MKQLVKQCVTTLEFGKFEGPLDEVLKYLNEQKRTAKKAGYSQLLIDFEYGYEGIECVCLFGSRLETDEEYALRIKILAEKEKRKKKT